MKKSCLLILLMAPLHPGFCAQALMVGEGEVITYPDYVELSITVDSKCYASPEEARKVNDEAARKVVDFLNTKLTKKDNYNTVIASGGYTSAYQTYSQEKVLCENTFQKQHTITFRTQQLDNFEKLFNEIQNNVYKQFPTSVPSIIDSSISYVTMDTPSPKVSTELQTKLVQQAIQKAFENGKDKLNAVFDKNKVQNLKVVSVSELPENQPKPLYANEAAPMALMGARADKRMAAAPVQFGNQTIHQTLYITFSFDDVLLN